MCVDVLRGPQRESLALLRDRVRAPCASRDLNDKRSLNPNPSFCFRLKVICSFSPMGKDHGMIFYVIGSPRACFGTVSARSGYLGHDARAVSTDYSTVPGEENRSLHHLDVRFNDAGLGRKWVFRIFLNQ